MGKGADAARRLLRRRPDLSIEQIALRLERSGTPLSAFTISVVRTHVIATLRALAQERMFDFDVGAFYRDPEPEQRKRRKPARDEDERTNRRYGRD